MSHRLAVLNPVAEAAVVHGEPAARPASLDGKALGIWWNTKRGGEIALKRIAEHLQHKYQGLRVEWFSEHYPASAETVSACAERSDIVVGATGD